MNPASRLIVSAMGIVIMASSCTGTVSPTPSPTAPTATATPSPTPNAEPTATVEPTGTATPGPTLISYPGPSIPAGTLTIEIGADPHLLFDPKNLAAPADTPIVIAFDNRDVCATTGGPACAGQTGLAHNVAIKLGGILLFNPLPAIIAPAKANYFISEGLPAGTYQFLCTVHPLMTGTLTVQ